MARPARPDWIDPTDVEDESERHRVFKLSTGSKIHFRKTPQYPMWTVAFDKGTLPAILQGKYISFKRAFDAATLYFANHEQRDIKILEEVK